MPSSSTRTTFHSIYDDSEARGPLGTFITRPQGVQLKASRTGLVNKDYKKQIRDLQEATTAMTAYTQSAKVTQRASLTCVLQPAYGGGVQKDTAFGIYEGNPSTFALPVSMFDTVPASVANRAKAEAIAAVNSKIRKINSPFNTQVFAAELHEVKQLLTGPLSKYTRLLTGLNALVKKGISKKDIPNLHLELQFGVVPLIMDIKDIMGVLNDKIGQKPVEVVKAFGKSSSVIYDSDITTTVYQSRKFHRRHRQLYTAEYFIRAGIAAEYQERAHGISALSDQLLDILQIPVTLWEITPYSFLIDYFVNVGDIIESTTTASSMVSWTSQTLIQTIESEIYSEFVPSAPDVFYSSITVDSSPFKQVNLKLRKVTRQGGSVGIPPMTVTLPGSAVRYANIAALLFSKLKL